MRPSQHPKLPLDFKQPLKNEMPAFIEAFALYGIKLTPAGIWALENNKKVPIDPKRVDGMSWSTFPKDNMARHFLSREQGIVVVDIDGEYIEFKDSAIAIPSLSLELPLTLYSTTTKPGSYHLYYSVSEEDMTLLPTRATHLKGSNVDIFTYGVIFEAHTFSPNHALYDLPMLEAPAHLIELIASLDLVVPVDAENQNVSEIIPTSNIARTNIVRHFLNDELTSIKQWNGFFRLVFPNDYIPKSKKKLTFQDFVLSYDLINKIAVKLTCTSELSRDVTVQALYKIIEALGRDPYSSKSQSLLFKNILPSLPDHDAIMPYSMEDDDKDFVAYVEAQPNTTQPVFRTIYNKKTHYIKLDKTTLRPVFFNGSPFLERSSVEALNPERTIFDEAGRKVGWDDNVPIVMTTTDANEPGYFIDRENDWHVLNLYRRSVYIESANPNPKVPTHNILYKTVASVVGPEYLQLVLTYYADVVFSLASPSMVLWVAALESAKGGTGKSLVTLEIPSLILQNGAASIDVKGITSGWGDIVAAVKLLSLEDIPVLAARDWAQLYAILKQQNTNAYKKLNMKGGSVITKKVKVAFTGSSNYRPPLSSSDRRFLCLEPAHLHGITQPLSLHEQAQLTKLVQSNDPHEQAIQEFTDYLYQIFLSPRSEEIERALYIEAPETPYRSKWIAGGSNNTKNILHTLLDARDFIAITKVDNLDVHRNQELLIKLLQFIVFVYDSDTQKIALPWRWFEAILPFVQSDSYAGLSYSKASIAQMLGVDFINCGERYIQKWRYNLPSYLPEEWSTWAQEGYVTSISDERIATYKEVISTLLGN